MDEDLMLNDAVRFLDLDEEEKISEDEYLEMYNAIGAALEVYNTLGRGMEEPIYQEALGIEFRKQQIPATPQAPLRTWYKDVLMDKIYYADFIVGDSVVVELKSVSRVISEHRSQLFNYMRITKHRRGILVNYGDSSFYAERYLYIPSIDDFVMLRKQNLQCFIKRKQ
ncbi:MAG: GxxExxY protein [Bacteroidales bacterium]|nr:GxxExxY protein [Bacteroidales bacterium]